MSEVRASLSRAYIILGRGNNKILNQSQEEAIRQYCYEQWDEGFGATHEMAYAAISQLKRARHYLLLEVTIH